jgi:hypothetical protein
MGEQRLSAHRVLGKAEAKLDPPNTGANDRCRFSQATFAGAHSNGRDAPIPAGRRVAVEPLESTDAPGPKSFKKEIDRSPPPGWRRILRQRRMVGTGGVMRSNSIQKECWPSKIGASLSRSGGPSQPIAGTVRF